MARGTELVTLVEELRLATRRPADLTAEDQGRQLALYAKRLADFDARDVADAVRSWPTEFWPAWTLLRAAVDDAALRRRQGEAANANRPRHGENFVGRCLRLGFHAGRLSAIGGGSWRLILERCERKGMADVEVAQALAWCEANPGLAWRPPRQAPTDDEIRATCRLVEAIRAQPERHVAVRALLAIGEMVVARHIEAGRAPSDVATWYEGLPAKYRDQLEAERAA